MRKPIFAVILLLLACLAWGQQIAPIAKPQFFDTNGDPLAGGLLYTYASGGTTPKATYTDATLGTPNANPVVLDSAGRADIWLTTGTYKFVLKTSAGATVWTVDSIPDLTSVQRIRAAATLPATCSPSTGDLAVLTAGNTGMYRCSATNTWSHVDTLGMISVKDYGAVGNGTTDDTAAIQSAVAAAGTAGGGTVYFTQGTYSIAPTATMVTAMGTTYYVGELKDNIHLLGAGGSIIKLRTNWSTNGSPKTLGVFLTNGAISNVSMIGLTFDMNGLNNGINNTAIQHAALMASADDSGISDLTVERNVFKNSAGCNVLVLGQSVSAGSVLAKRVIIRDNYFIDNGLDTPDFSAIYAWCNDVLITNNLFYNASMATVTKAAFELHGSRSTFSNNVVTNYTMGGWIGENYTSICSGQKVIDNFFLVDAIGVGVWASDAIGLRIRDAEISGNMIEFDNTVITGGPGYKTGIWLSLNYGISGIDVMHNTVHGSASVAESVRGIWARCDQTSAELDEVRILYNRFHAVTIGILFASVNANGSIGLIDINDNIFHNLVDNGVWSSMGIFGDCATAKPCRQVGMLRNTFIDDKTVPAMKYGAYVGGKYTNLIVGRNYYQGMTVNNYLETTGSDASPSLVTGIHIGDGDHYGFSQYTWTDGSSNTLLTMSSAGIVPRTLAFAALGTPGNGTVVYCSDCTVASPCAGSGTGALAKRLNGAWICN